MTSLLAKDIDQKIKKYKQHNASLSVCMTMTTEVAVAMEENNDNSKVPELERSIKEYIELEGKVTNQIAALAEIKNSLLSGDLREDSNLVKIFEKRLDQLAVQNEAYRKHAKYREFRQKVIFCWKPMEELITLCIGMASSSSW